MKLGELQPLLVEAVESAGYILWGVEYFNQGQHSLLRVYIDKEDGITVDDCAEASRQINAVLEINDPIKGEYTLEVSSPGLERPLFTLEQCQQFVGHHISANAYTPIEGQRNFKGMLLSVENAVLQLETPKKTVEIPWAQIRKAHIVYDEK